VHAARPGAIVGNGVGTPIVTPSADVPAGADERHARYQTPTNRLNPLSLQTPRRPDTIASMIDVDDFAATARAWLAEHAGAAPPDYGAICPPDLVEHAVGWHRLLHTAGYTGIHWPAQHGGRGLTPEHQGAWLVAAAEAGVPAMFNMVGLVLTAGAILQFGTDEQRREHLAPTATADRLWCQLFSEPGSGSDLASLSTRAELVGDLATGTFVVNGQKVWCSGGRYSDWGILLARTRTDGAKHEGISFVLVPMDLPGIEIRPLRQMTGDAEFDEVFFTDVEVPATNLVGPLHSGWQLAMSVLTNERGHIGTAIVGLERRLERMAALADARSLGAIERQRLAELLARGNAYRALAARQGAGAATAGSLLKLGITEMVFDTSMFRGGLAGADALLAGPDASGMLAAPGGRIAGGTSQVQRNIIGERLLGLPREPREPRERS
jgi:alkylation response protein AidB-like acyl-CoA dehydrogenase